MNKTTSCMILVLLLLALFSSCNSNPQDETNETTSQESITYTLKPTAKWKQTTDSYYTYPDGISEAIKKTAEIFFEKMTISREAALSNAEAVNKAGIEEILEMKIKIAKQGVYHVPIIDKDGNHFYMIINEHGYPVMICRGDEPGDIVWIPIM